MAHKGAALAEPALDLELGVMPAQGIFHDGEPEAGATTLPRPAAIRPAPARST